MAPSTMMLTMAIANRNSAETEVPTIPPTALNAAKRFCSALAAKAINTVARRTTVEWPSEK